MNNIKNLHSVVDNVNWEELRNKFSESPFINFSKTNDTFDKLK